MIHAHIIKLHDVIVLSLVFWQQVWMCFSRFLDALASLKTMFKIKWVTHVFKFTRFQEYYRLLQSFAEYYRVLQSIAEFCRVLQIITEYYRVLQSIAGHCKVLQSTAELYRVLQSIAEYYRVLQSISSAPTSANFWACLATGHILSMCFICLQLRYHCLREDSKALGVIQLKKRTEIETFAHKWIKCQHLIRAKNDKFRKLESKYLYWMLKNICKTTWKRENW